MIDAPHTHAERPALGFAIVTVSDTRTPETDTSGQLARELAEAEGHRVVSAVIVHDELPDIRREVDALLARRDVDVLVLTGGTGVAPRDVTPEAVRPLLDKELPGFGELFRVLSFEEVGTRTLASRAFAGVARGKPVFALPGSTAGVRLAVTRLVLPEAGHLRALADPDHSSAGGSRVKSK